MDATISQPLTKEGQPEVLRRMQIFVRSITGETRLLEVSPTETIQNVKLQLQTANGVDSSEQLLTYGLHALDDDMTILEAGIEEESTVFQSVELLGGGKKRKKKTYTKPKKTKHKKKPVKLAVLKFYKVDGDDKVSRLRKDCPATTCGAGVFMAQHRNRTYCGRCGLTYIMKVDPEE
eukprot:GHVT01105091.1.p1 GENE.GHVT01105091.1~~GHVT01105091.1.p1  ORF type:complete len:177 (+),score=26.87 GHVT01105091.1:59-589(+)